MKQVIVKRDDVSERYVVWCVNNGVKIKHISSYNKETALGFADILAKDLDCVLVSGSN